MEPQVIGALVGLAAAAVLSGVAFGFARARAARAESERELALARTAAAEAGLGEVRGQVAELKGQLVERDLKIDMLQSDLAQQRERRVEAETRLQEERSAAQDKLRALDEARQKLLDAFKALSADTLRDQSRAFLQLAEQSMKTFQDGARGDLEQRQQSIADLVQPVKQSIERVDQKLQQVETERAGAYGELLQQVKALQTAEGDLKRETANLVQALRRPQVRGRWGEIQLKRVVELAGMVEYCDFAEQVSQDTEDGRLRPDLVVRLPGGTRIVVDAKAPLDAYLSALEAREGDDRTKHLQDHARQVRNHIQGLSRKSYWEQFTPSPDFVVLFLPGETFFAAALEQDPGLIEFGVESRVIVATPTTLIALLRAVFYGWRNESLARNTKEISDLGRDLYQRLSVLGDHLAKVGKNLGSAVGSYNEMVASLESRVLPSARKFVELGAASADVELSELKQVDKTPRLAQAPELLPPAGADDAGGQRG